MKKRGFFRQQQENETLDVKRCEFGTCEKEGLYQAPKADLSSHQKRPDSWYWFCLDHVRDYNASWNYFREMSEAEILKEWRQDITWQRPTWPLGSWYTRKSMAFEHVFSARQNKDRHFFDDPFGLFDDYPGPQEQDRKRPNTPESQAVLLLELSVPFDKDQLQTAYRRLVKKFHPDLNQGCLLSEEKLKQINQAYTLLKKGFSL